MVFNPKRFSFFQFFTAYLLKLHCVLLWLTMCIIHCLWDFPSENPRTRTIWVLWHEIILYFHATNHTPTVSHNTTNQ